ncbi:GNAT family N-acetyltransferase [Aeromonas hydrophila]|uniref:GNAT family N-acetyltransferase n=1 Tax=Aeromonas hydrophila TaxID=644 RepID=UPI0004DB1BAE|nr:GNAT family N-acetyltransferase [Aeromonas hydrophila]EJN6956051.1 GNAT family N-acetyltransferase [Aeromonas hydrophila]KER63095.1 GCN5 family acetyltransferase [Aeromonas hydrophila]MCX4042334.1 GNAT family N-acetyltransferase [Aeromonas hydrophila]OCA66230.1 GCN5 family acetyltransferase [Aeromonas hydrophila]OCY02222.1 GCN5 family acetyltransferase [Aeromonas hydrophila]
MKMEQEIAMIRPACVEDVAAMADLLGQLGYPVSPQVLRDRWLAPDPAREVLVACLAEEIAGVLVWHWLSPLHVAPAWGLISALVVDEGARGCGVGAALLAAAEERARAQGCSQLELSSSLKREGAHRFYLAQGYVERPKRFVKTV